MTASDLPPYPSWGTRADRVRWARYVLVRPELCGAIGERATRAAMALLKSEADDIRAHPGRPLRRVELWRPECPVCIDPTWPADPDRGGCVNGEGKPCGMVRPGSRGLRVHGYAMTHEGGGVHRCPVCGLSEVRTSQAVALAEILSTEATIFVLIGGNRSSKSVTGRLAAIVAAHGTDHPDVRALLTRNGIAAPRIQPGPRMVYSGALTNADSRDYVRPGYASLLPSWQWQNQGGIGDAVAWPEGSGPAQPGCIVFKSCDAGAKRWQGASVPLIHVDESHADAELLGEQEMRVADVGGLILVTATPTRGMDPMFADILDRQPEPRPSADVARYVLDPLDNPFINQDAMRRRFAGMTERARRVKRHGEFVKVEGLVHPGWDPAVHVIPSIPLEKMRDWPRVDACDFGFRAPFAYGWGAVDPHGTLHVYRLRYVARVTTDEHILSVLRAESCPSCWPSEAAWPSDAWWDARWAAQASCKACDGTGRGWPEPYARAADPADADARAQWAARGVPTVPARKARRAGFELLDQLLTVQDGRPGLVVHDHPSTADLRREIAALAFKRPDDDPRVGASERVEMEVVGDDHAWDMLRYMAMEARALRLISGGGG